MSWESHSSRSPQRRPNSKGRTVTTIVLTVLMLWPALATTVRAAAMALPAGLAASDSLKTDEVKKRGWVAASQTAGINVLVWSYNRFIREGGTNPGFRIGFDSWKENIKNGFEWDDNGFANNLFAHPYHGNLYFNAARSNGFGFWESIPFTVGGSLMWEYMMENHHPAYNDWISTSIGGVALGESTYRLSLMVWDNSATGSDRFWREVGGFLINPMGGLTRLLDGNTGKVRANPPDRYPSEFTTRLEVGTRTTGEDRIWEADTTRVYVRAGFSYGDPFQGDIEKPFDSFDFDIQVNFGDEAVLGQVAAKGLLFATELSETENSQHLVGAYQHYTYVHNSAYQMGGQAISASYMSKVDAGSSSLVTMFHADGMLLGASKSDYANFTGRSYSYGPGVGFQFLTSLHRRGRPFFSLGHATHWLFIINGDAATHQLNYTFGRLDVPVGPTLSIGAEYVLYYAERNYRDFPDVTQRSPEVRLNANWLIR